MDTGCGGEMGEVVKAVWEVRIACGKSVWGGGGGEGMGGGVPVCY